MQQAAPLITANIVFAAVLVRNKLKKQPNAVYGSSQRLTDKTESSNSSRKQNESGKNVTGATSPGSGVPAYFINQATEESEKKKHGSSASSYTPSSNNNPSTLPLFVKFEEKQPNQPRNKKKDKHKHNNPPASRKGASRRGTSSKGTGSKGTSSGSAKRKERK